VNSRLSYLALFFHALRKHLEWITSLESVYCKHSKIPPGFCQICMSLIEISHAAILEEKYWKEESDVRR
jgi:hypothetical protein